MAPCPTPQAPCLNPAYSQGTPKLGISFCHSLPSQCLLTRAHYLLMLSTQIKNRPDWIGSQRSRRTRPAFLS